MSAKPLILALEDEPNVLKLMEQALEPVGYEVITSLDGRQALELIAEEKPQLVLLDSWLAGKSGIEVFHEIRRNYPDIAVVMVVVITEVDIAINTLKEGAFGYLIKPFSINELIIDVERAIERRGLILENRDYRLNFEKRINGPAQLLEQKTRELAALNNLFVTSLNQNFEAAERLDYLAASIIKMAERVQQLARQAEAVKWEYDPTEK